VSNKKLQIAPYVISKKVQQDEVLLDSQAGIYYTLDGTAAFIWSLIRSGASKEAILEALEAHYESQPEDLSLDLEQFLIDLRASRLIL
jgi:hypothetical protein